MPPKKATGKAVTTASKTAAKKPASKPGTTGAKKGTTTTTKGKATAAKPKETKPEVPKWTPQDEAARKIQTQIRGFLARKKLEKLKKERQDYLDLMERLEKEAFAKLVKMEQEKYEQQRQKEEAERRRKADIKKRQNRILEAAFDGDNDEMLTILKEATEADNKQGVGHDLIGKAIRNRHQRDLIEAEDAHGNTPMSEASNGGHADSIKWLIDRGGDPNTQGQFGRSPLYRAAFGGHLETVQMLLQHGADPRIYASDGQNPEQVAANGAIADLLRDWDIEQTDRLLAKIEADKEKVKEEEKKRRLAETNLIEEELKEAEYTYKRWQVQICKCSEELNKRITEHDQCVASGFEKPEITIAAIHDAEAELEIVRIRFEEAQEKLQQVKLRLREKQNEDIHDGVTDEDLPGIKINIKELDDVLLRDVGNRIKDSGKWPLLIDPSSQAATFLRYRDTNYLNALSPLQMEPDKIRQAVIGAIRYGKPLILDMMMVDMFETVTERFDEVEKGLMDMILDKNIQNEHNYLKLCRESDGPEYDPNNFNEDRVKRFMFVILTKNPFQPEHLLDRVYLIRIHIPT